MKKYLPITAISVFLLIYVDSAAQTMMKFDRKNQCLAILDAAATGCTNLDKTMAMNYYQQCMQGKFTLKNCSIKDLNVGGLPIQKQFNSQGIPDAVEKRKAEKNKEAFAPPPLYLMTKHQYLCRLVLSFLTFNQTNDANTNPCNLNYHRWRIPVIK